MLSAALDGITIHHIDESGNVVLSETHKGPETDDAWSRWRGNGKVVLMNKGKEASPDLLNMGGRSYSYRSYRSYRAYRSHNHHDDTNKA